MLSRSKKDKIIELSLTPEEQGVFLSFSVVDGMGKEPLFFPLTDVGAYYRLKGFHQYIACEELNDIGAIVEGHIPFDAFYELLTDELNRDLLRTLGLPTESIEVAGMLQLLSLPQQGELKLTLRDHAGRNLDRLGIAYGCLYKVNGDLVLLPEAIYQLKKAMTQPYESGLERIAVCQKLAKDAGLQFDDFLNRETFHLVDSYDLDVQVHGPDHIEIIPKSGDIEVKPLVSSKKDGMNRERFIPSPRVREDIRKLAEKRHIHGAEVPLFLDNPSAVLPEHEYTINLDEFSDRVKGIVPIERVYPMRQPGSSNYQWFDQNTGEDIEFGDGILRELMISHPNEQYVHYDGRWVYLDPVMRRELLGGGNAPKETRPAFTLDIYGNEDELEYEINEKGKEADFEYSLPLDLRADLFEHQRSGYQWLCKLDADGKGGLLADDMGVGKTLQVISYFAKLFEEGRLRPCLIVVPIVLVKNWEEELAKFAPHLPKPYIHLGQRRFRNNAQIEQFDIVITSYDTLKFDQLILGKIDFQIIVCDEAQNVKSFSSQRSRALRAMSGKFRLAMTGTPVENRLEELWAIMDYVQPGCLGSLKGFRKQYTEEQEYEHLFQAIRPYYLRRTKAEVLKNKLPEKHVNNPIEVHASKEQQALSRSMLERLGHGNLAILNMLMQLRQLYGHPGAVVPVYESLPSEQVPKLQEVIKILDAIKAKDEKVLIFTEFRKIQSILKRTLIERYGISVPVINGESKSKQESVHVFNQSVGFGAMILSPKAAGVGLNITSANHVIHYTRWWNPAVENQATDRVYRIGQQKDVYVYYVITKDTVNFPNGTVEEIMHQLLESKRELAENVIVPFDISGIQMEIAERFTRGTEH